MVSYYNKTLKSVCELFGLLGKKKKNHFFQYTCFHRRLVLNKENLHVNTGSENKKQNKNKNKKNLKRHFESHSKKSSMMLLYHLYSHYNFEAKDNIQSY